MAAGMARHGLLPVVNSFASFLASRANEQIYNQASERTKVVYAMHYAGLIPAGPGKSHQSLRDASLMAAIPGVAVVHPCNAEETRALVEWAVLESTESVAIRLAIGPSPRRIELPDGLPRRRRASASSLRDGSGRDARLLRARDAARGAHRGGAARRAGIEVWRRRPPVARPGRRGRGSPSSSPACATCSSSRITRPSGALGDTLRRALASLPDRAALDVAGVEGWPACGTPAEALRAPRARRRVARRAGRADAREPRARVSGRPVWVVVADPLTARTFFDCGIVDGLAAQLRDRLRLAFAFRREEADVWAARVPAGVAVLHAEELQPSSVRQRRAPRRGAPTGGSTRASATTRSRSGSTCGTASIASGCCRGTGTSSSTRTASARCPCDRPIERAMRRWHFGPRRYVASALRGPARGGATCARPLEPPDAVGDALHRRGPPARPDDGRLRRELGPHGRQGRDLARPRALRRAERAHARRPRPLPRRPGRADRRHGLAAGRRLPRAATARGVRRAPPQLRPRSRPARSSS